MKIKYICFVIIFCLLFTFSITAIYDNYFDNIQKAEELKAERLLYENIFFNNQSKGYSLIIKLSTTKATMLFQEETKYRIAAQKIYNDFWSERAEKYPYISQLWQLLEQNGYNNHVIAGIIGNIMVECGGCSFSLDPGAKNNDTHYGICQWSKKYYPQVWDQDLIFQFEFLISNIKNQFDTFGKLYKDNFNYDLFLDLNNEQEAALAFAKCYERCGVGSYEKRQECATIAYNQFTLW